MRVDNKDRSQGQKLLLSDLEHLRVLIDNKFKRLSSYSRANAEQDLEVFERYAENPQDIATRRELIRLIQNFGDWTLELAAEMKADLRSIENYVYDPGRLNNRIKLLKESGGRARKFRGEARQVFVEGVRLLSTTISDLVTYLPSTYFPYMPPIFGSMDERPRMDTVVSRATFANEARLCFDTTGSMTIKRMRANKDLQSVIESSLRDWPVGTVGVHAVNVQWHMDHDGDRTRMQDGKKGGTLRLLIMAERKEGAKEVGFSPIPCDASDGEKASMVKEFLESLRIPTRLLCMTTELRDGQIVPTAMNLRTLEDTLGAMIEVRLDAPTRGLGPIKVKGRHKSEEDFCKYLAMLLN